MADGRCRLEWQGATVALPCEEEAARRSRGRAVAVHGHMSLKWLRLQLRARTLRRRRRALY